MYGVKVFFVTLFYLTSVAWAEEWVSAWAHLDDDTPTKVLTHELIPVSKTVFKVINLDTEKEKP